MALAISLLSAPKYDPCSRALAGEFDRATTLKGSTAMAHRFNVRCMMCGRTAGLVHDGVFRRLPNTPPLVARGGRTSCGFCRGSLYLEADDGATSLPMATVDGRERTAPERVSRRRAS
jgi:hypothetical protein